MQVYKYEIIKNKISFVNLIKIYCIIQYLKILGYIYFEVKA